MATSKNFEVKNGLSVGGTERISSAGVGTFTDLNVTGTTTTIDTATLQVQDKNIVINYGTGDTSSTASGAGITIQDAVDASNDATILWDASADEFDFSHTVTAPSLTIAGNAAFDTSTLVVDSSNNRVGIGTASPAQALTVQGRMVELNNSGIQVVSIQASSDHGQIVLNNSSGVAKTLIHSQGDSYFTGGNLGIGTSSPSGRLMVREDTAGNPARLIISNGGNAQSGTTSRLSFYEEATEKSYIERRRDNSGITAFVTPADDNPFVWENTSGEFMRFTGSKVGIGTTSPQDKLHVYDGDVGIENSSGRRYRLIAESNGGFTIRDQTAAAGRLAIDSTGSLSAGATTLTSTDLNWGHDSYQRPHIFSGDSGGSPSDGPVVSASAVSNPSNSRIGAFIFGCKTSTTSGVSNSGLKAFIEGYTNTNVGEAWKTGGYMKFWTRPDNGNPTERLRITSDGHVLPATNNTYDLGSTALGFRNIYTNDLNLSNMAPTGEDVEGNAYTREGNEIDGTNGSWTIQEGSDDLFLINRLNNKKYKFNLTEVTD